MKKLVAAVAIVAFSASMAMAADVMTFQSKMGNITFPHKMHQQIAQYKCKVCHEKGPGKIENFNMDFVNKTCIPCHKAKGQGPTTCTGCHKR